MSSADAWIELLLKRSMELRKAGVLSIGCEGNSAVLAPLERGAGDDEPSDATKDEPDEERDAWENPTSYPTGSVPTLGDVDPVEKLPAIPEFDS